MIIKCKATKRFLGNIQIEEYYNTMKKYGLKITVPIIIELPCPRCKMIEVYKIYPNTYEHIKSYKNN